MRLAFVAYGRPIPQGSVRSLGAGRPSIHNNARTLLPWRDTISGAARTAAALDGWKRTDLPVSVYVTFYFDRPRSHYRTGRNAHLLRDGIGGDGEQHRAHNRSKPFKHGRYPPDSPRLVNSI